jgi:hypothetical protein
LQLGGLYARLYQRQFREAEQPTTHSTLMDAGVFRETG